MPFIKIRPEWKGGENDKENMLAQIDKVQKLSRELYEAVRKLDFGGITVVMEEAPSEGKSDEACKVNYSQDSSQFLP